jgi:hypothetical protein
MASFQTLSRTVSVPAHLASPDVVRTVHAVAHATARALGGDVSGCASWADAAAYVVKVHIIVDVPCSWTEQDNAALLELLDDALLTVLKEAQCS